MLKTKTKKEFLAGYNLEWSIVDKPSSPVGRVVKGVVVSRDGYLSPMTTGVLAQLLNLQFPFTDTITCEKCNTDASTLQAAHAKGALVHVAFDQAGINLWDYNPQSKPGWVDDYEQWGSLEACIEGWRKLVEVLLKRSWISETPATLSVEDVTTTLKHHRKTWLGLRSESLSVTPDQARLFIAFCDTSGLLDVGDPGPGGDLFGDSLQFASEADVFLKLAASLTKMHFSQPERPEGWEGAIQGFSTRCYGCTVAANPVLNSLIQPLSPSLPLKSERA
jgi:hypothetical protein